MHSGSVSSIVRARDSTEKKRERSRAVPGEQDVISRVAAACALSSDGEDGVMGGLHVFQSTSSCAILLHARQAKTVYDT